MSEYTPETLRQADASALDMFGPEAAALRIAEHADAWENERRAEALESAISIRDAYGRGYTAGVLAEKARILRELADLRGAPEEAHHE